MRFLRVAEVKQRGCKYCTHCKRTTGRRIKGELNIQCPFDECPYHELDKYKSYSQYLKSDESKIVFNIIPRLNKRL